MGDGLARKFSPTKLYSPWTSLCLGSVPYHGSCSLFLPLKHPLPFPRFLTMNSTCHFFKGFFCHSLLSPLLLPQSMNDLPPHAFMLPLVYLINTNLIPYNVSGIQQEYCLRGDYGPELSTFQDRSHAWLFKLIKIKLS